MSKQKAQTAGTARPYEKREATRGFWIDKHKISLSRSHFLAPSRSLPPAYNDAMTPAELASKIDHTLLKPEAQLVDVDKVIAEAIEHLFCSVCISPIHVAHTASRLRGTGVLTCTVVGFPHGTSKSVLKAIEATGLVKDGADEVDVVAHLPYLATGDLSAARAELLELVRAVRAVRREVVVKVIIESAYLLSLGADRGESAIATACQAIRESGCDFVKTSTGFHPAGGATVEAIGLMRKYGAGLKVKAAGGMRDLASAQAFLAAGADRLGMSASVSVVNELKNVTTAALDTSSSY